MAASTQVKDAFVEFVENVPFYGAALLCVDHPEVQSIIPRLRDRRVVTYGFAAQADVRGENVAPVPGRQPLRRRRSATAHGDGRARSTGIELPMPGRHNVQNALAAIGVALELGIADEVIAARLRQVRRRQAALHQGRRGRRRRRSSTITATIRSRSARCSPPRARAPRGG